MPDTDSFLWRAIARLFQYVGIIAVLVPPLGYVEPKTLPGIVTAILGAAALTFGASMRTLERRP